MSNVVHLNEPNKTKLGDHTGNQYSQLNTYYDSEYKIGWFLMSGEPRPCFTPTLLNDLTAYLSNVKAEMAYSGNKKYDYLVVGSDVPGIFNLGGDLNLFRELIDEQNYEGLLSYATQCINILYQNLFHFNLELTTVSLIQGDALGGGFEAALSSNLIIAERGVKLGLPEVLFNLFPGMGAFTLLSRKIGPTAAERMILSGKLYDSEELYDMGIIDILAEPGEGELALYKYVKKARRSPNSYQAMAKVKDISNNISYQELIDIAQVWAEAALNLTSKDLKMMERLINRQNSKSN
ncbi:MAG: crotonase/enoyl-CoA hydratase family protein [Piscirickettsiaceae bacterium]|nr:crotonase/enoyl-CoA hydratase family protein [Piscirickettsiaceae bacterium]